MQAGGILRRPDPLPQDVAGLGARPRREQQRQSGPERGTEKERPQVARSFLDDHVGLGVTRIILRHASLPAGVPTPVVAIRRRPERV